MTHFDITYIKTGSGETKNTDTVMLSERDSFDFGGGAIEIHNITDAIRAFEIVAAKWGTYETRNSIINIAVWEN